MKKIIKIVIEEENDNKLSNITKADEVTLQNIFKGNITQIAYTKDYCENCESRVAGADYCAGCKDNGYNMFAIKQD